jgi:hypothetical protein
MRKKDEKKEHNEKETEYVKGERKRGKEGYRNYSVWYGIIFSIFKVLYFITCKKKIQCNLLCNE